MKSYLLCVLSICGLCLCVARAEHNDVYWEYSDSSHWQGFRVVQEGNNCYCKDAAGNKEICKIDADVCGMNTFCRTMCEACINNRGAWPDCKKSAGYIGSAGNEWAGSDMCREYAESSMRNRGQNIWDKCKRPNCKENTAACTQ